MSSRKKDGEQFAVAGIELETVRRGSGRQILVLHGFQTIDPNAPFLELLARLGEVADMADAVVFLASDAARFITGAGLPVDGGMGM